MSCQYVNINLDLNVDRALETNVNYRTGKFHQADIAFFYFGKTGKTEDRIQAQRVH